MISIISEMTDNVSSETLKYKKPSCR